MLQTKLPSELTGMLSLRNGVRREQSEGSTSCLISGNAIAGPCLQTRFGGERKDLDSVLSLTSGFVRCRETKESFQTLLVDSHFIGLDSVSLESRWPTECQVLADKVRHLKYNPVEPEPFYVPTGKEPKPKPIGEESGTVLFHYCPTGVTNYFSRSCIGGSAVSIPDTIERTADCVTRSSATDLCFESRFESGNLGKVIKITDTFYELHLRNDLYTQRHTQWYYFRISNTKSGTMYRLSIVNLWKENSLYNEGLKPLLYSTKDATAKSIGWRRCGENIIYYKNDSSDDRKEKHTLTFNIYFPHDQDTVYLAYCYPYTYTDLQEYLIKIANDSIKSRFTKLRMLCRSLAGNAIYYLTITAPTINDETQRKKGVVITARVHPGETPSSWIMKGIIDFLTGESNQAKELRERFIFKLVPMLNPDGVIVGNNRCSLSGVDLNRQYRTVIRESYPAVWHTKLMIRRLMEECGIALYCDLHAHSRKHNVFIYGCENKRGGCIGTLAEQVFPLMLHKNAADKFSFESCKFHIEKSKEGTGRVVVWLMGIQNSYTLEASLGGSKLGSRSGTHFSTQDYEQTGKAFCETLLDFSDNDPIKENLRNKILSRLAKEGSSADEPTNIDLTDYSSDEGDTSDSLSENDEKYDEEMLKRSGLYIEDPRYLCVPPTSSVLLKPATIDPIRKTKKPKGNLSKNVLSRKKLMHNRKAMDLPRTDPGSDLYELSDSDDETNVRSATKMKSKSSDEDAQFSGKENQQKIESDLSFPLIVRPRSLSLGEEIISEDLTRKNKRRLRHRRMPRTLRNLSPLMQRSQHVQMKLLTLRRQVWTGVGNLKLENEKDKLSLTNNYPLSWGVPKMPYEHQTNDEVSIEPCSKKLDELGSGKSDLKKQKKKVRKKSTKIIDAPSEVNNLEEENRQTKKKKPRAKRHKVVKSSLEPLDNNTIMVTSDGLDSLKLCGTAKLPKILSKHKTDSRRKLNKLIGSAAITAAKSKVKSHADSVGDSSSAENSPVVIRRNSIKKKYNSSTGKKLTPSVIIAKKNTK
ncbi:PREDICTED: cytosolic carboxypeptidase 2-like [Ceratosolen solmsi marchali]|uniref:Cytosolic carboxypeptidase 2-like n=1 Tax=Ceratosolen solmsi marchali TaxID=326594 RepID=A0AAJ6YPQ6_9HYME|nr:PREDICTED: cytosolic carboxypeptidase 2-like [Ceratosolen solmsi marchali]